MAGEGSKSEVRLVDPLSRGDDGEGGRKAEIYPCLERVGSSENLIYSWKEGSSVISGRDQGAETQTNRADMIQERRKRKFLPAPEHADMSANH